MLIGTYNAQDIEQLRQRHPDQPQALERLIGQPDLDGVYHIDTHGDPWREWHGQPPVLAKPPFVDSGAFGMRLPELIPDDHDPQQEQRRMTQGGCCGQASKAE